MKANDIRSSFINYFKNHGHQHVTSSSLIPENDPTLLFTNAGMNQFKNVFLGVEKRDYTRAVSSQKCVRAGGKHNDLENVGHTARHHTFFEMLGNFSFGDYFKKDAIHFAWEYVTKELKLPKDRLYVTVFTEDDEAANIWHKQEGVPADRIYRFGEKDNFWRMGETGPCGPCSEIFFDLGPEVGGDPKQNVMGGEGDRYLEFWNLVFMQYYEDESGKRSPLPNPSIDTGAGLERMAAILQGQLNNYHTDVFTPLIEAASQITKKDYVFDLSKTSTAERSLFEKQNVAFRVLADHARSTAFLLADGVLPSNDGRGYVLRRIMRRAIRYGRTLTTATHLLPAVVEKVIAQMGDIYPELRMQQTLISTTVRDEEQRFLATLDQGTEILQEQLNRLKNKGQKVVPGDVVFKLYDTFGFPVDLTRLMAAEQSFSVDEAQFEAHMQQARQKAKASWKGTKMPSDQAHLIQMSQELADVSGVTRFLGYAETNTQANLLLLSTGNQKVGSLKAGESGLMVFNNTPFYAEGGGQVGDSGHITSAHAEAEVGDCTKLNEIYFHHVTVKKGEFKVGEKCELTVTESDRRATACNHSATHLLHSALRQVLGHHVTQAGSLVDPDRLRFDFTHNKPLTTVEMAKIEELVNQQVSHGFSVGTQEMSPDEAMKAGALALFGEKYGETVRVVKMGDFSMELCGGTHVTNTAMIRVFKIVSEGGVSSGVRRIEAITGDQAVRYLMKHTSENIHIRQTMGLHENWSQYLNDPESANASMAWVEALKQDVKKLQKEIQSLKGQEIDLDNYLNQATPFSSDGQQARLVFADVEVDDRQVLSDVTDKLRDKVQSGLVVVIGKGNGTHPLIVSVSKNLAKSLHAGKILKDLAEVMEGKGGGRPDFAQGAAKNRSKLPEALAKAKELVGAV